MDYLLENKRKNDTPRKILLAAALTALFVYMLKRPPGISGSTKVPSHSLFMFPVSFTCILMIVHTSITYAVFSARGWSNACIGHWRRRLYWFARRSSPS